MIDFYQPYQPHDDSAFYFPRRCGSQFRRADSDERRAIIAMVTAYAASYEDDKSRELVWKEFRLYTKGALNRPPPPPRDIRFEAGKLRIVTAKAKENESGN